MESKRITIEIEVGVLEDQQMPDETRIFDKLIDHLYDYIIDNAAIVQTVHITEVDGQSTHESE
jgi:hypothetical protein